MSQTPTSTTGSQFLQELFEIQREQSFRDPMFDALRTGSMSRAGVLRWTLQASLVVRQFTRFISAIHANCPHRDAQQLLAENLWEEHGQGVSERDHYALVRKLARSLGATDQDLDDAQPLAETQEYITHCLTVTREHSFIESMTAIAVGIEFFMPRFFGAMADSLCSKYGLERGDVDYLMVHVAEDEMHSQRALAIIDSYSDTPELRQKAKDALRDMLLVKRRYALAVYDYCAAAE
jgi:pyrroloquinoline quinone (PQQ) biosynthesis protein C